MPQSAPQHGHADSSAQATELREAELLREALRGSPLVAFIQDLDLRYVWICNPHLGPGPDEMLGRRDADLFPADEAARLTTLKRRVLDTGAPEHAEVDVTSRAGPHTCYDLSVNPYRDLSGRVVGVSCVALDITDMKRAEMSLRESEARLRVAMEAGGIVVWEWDVPSGQIRYSSNASQQARGDDLGRYQTLEGLLSQVRPEHRENFRAALNQTVQEGCPFEHEYLVCRLDGTYHWTSCKGQRVVLDGGRVVRVIGIAQDTDERRFAEEELLKRSHQLAELASELTLAEHRQRKLLAVRLHDNLQQLIVGARMQVESLLKRPDKDFLTKLTALLNVLKDALDASRDITKDLAPPVLLHRDLAGAIEWLGRDMYKRYDLNVAVETVDVPDALPESVTVLFYTAARELLFNVVKHAGIHEAALKLRHDAGVLTLEVRDEGRGFDSHEYVRAAHDAQSFGLLSIRERIELMAGTLAVNTTPGQGTRVTLCLPLMMPTHAPNVLKGPEASVASVGPAAGAGARTARTGERIRLVLADDHRTVREGIMALLRAHPGFDVVAQADNGKQAYACVEHYQPDVVLMDISMPVMDGFEATRLIKEKWPGVRIIGLSMYEDAGVIARMRAAGVDRYVAKSAPPDELINAIVEESSQPLPGVHAFARGQDGAA